MVEELCLLHGNVLADPFSDFELLFAGLLCLLVALLVFLQF
jgi:hypothetical protein